MRNTLILAAAAFALLSAPALAQSSPAHPVMPPVREYLNPNANMTPTNNGMYGGGAVAPYAAMRHKTHNGKMKAR